jgi:hypothetical protein
VPRLLHPPGVDHCEVTSRLLVLRLVCLPECGRFHELEPKQRNQPELWARAVHYSVGTAAVCTHRQQSPRVSVALVRAVWTHLNNRPSLIDDKQTYKIWNLLLRNSFHPFVIACLLSPNSVLFSADLWSSQRWRCRWWSGLWRLVGYFKSEDGGSMSS